MQPSGAGGAGGLVRDGGAAGSDGGKVDGSPGGAAGGAAVGGSGGSAAGGAAGSAGGGGGGASGGAAGTAGNGGMAGAGVAGAAGTGIAGAGGLSGNGGTAGASGGMAGSISGRGGSAPAETGTIYAVLAQCPSPDCFAVGIVAIDVASGVAVRDTSLFRATDLAYRNGALLVARDGGHTRISVLDPDTLAVVGTRFLPWDPRRAVFSRDGRYMYAIHVMDIASLDIRNGEGYLSQVRIADGVTTAEIRLWTGHQVDEVGIAMDPTDTLLGLTANSSADPRVAMVRINGESLSVVHDIAPQPFSTSNCRRRIRNPAFDRAGALLAVHDPNCDALDVYDVATGALSSPASVLFDRGEGINLYGSVVADSLGQFWSVDEENLFRTSAVDVTRRATFPLGVLTTASLVVDPTGRNVYLFADDPRRNGVFKVDLETGATTRLPWNLDLIPYDSPIATMTYATR